MLDERPAAAELIAAVAAFLEKKVSAQLDAHTAFHAKIAVNVLHIVERELRQGAAASGADLARLRELLGDAAGTETDLAALNAALCARIDAGTLATDDTALRAHLLSSVLARLAIDNPKYPSLQKAGVNS